MWIEKFQVKKTNKIVAIYPTTKLWLVGLYSIGAIILGTVNIFGAPILLIPYFLIVVLLGAVSGDFKGFCNDLKKVIFISVLIFLVQALIVPGGEILYSLGFIKISEIGLQTGTKLAMSIMSIAGIFVWLFNTTENKEITRALEKSGLNHKASYVFLSTMQMIDLLGRNSKTIMNAQQARGVETGGNIFSRAKAFVPSLIPLILGAIVSSEDRALTLESKGFDVNCTKTHILDVNKSGNETLAMVIGIALLLIVIGIRGVTWLM